MQGLPGLQPAAPYRYVLLHLWIITVTRRSVNLAIASAALTFTALQVSASGPKPLSPDLEPSSRVPARARLPGSASAEGLPACFRSPVM